MKTAGALFAALFLVSVVQAQVNFHAQWQEDLVQFRAEFLETDTSYTIAERKQAEALLAELEKNLNTLSNPQIELALAEIAAVTDNGHSFLMPGGWTARYPRLPIEFHVFADGIFVINATEDHEQLVGRKLKSIDGKLTEELRKTWARYQGGTEGWRDQFLPYFLETPAILHAAGLAAKAASTCLELLGEDRETTTHCLEASRDLPALEGFDQYIVPSRLLRIAANAEPIKQPLYLQQPERVFRVTTIDDLNAVYLQFRANVDFSGTEDINAFLESARNLLSSQPWPWIILDERFNFGGDLTTTRELMKDLRELRPFQV